MVVYLQPRALLKLFFNPKVPNTEIFSCNLSVFDFNLEL